MKINYTETTFAENIRKTTETRLDFKPDGGEENQLFNLYPEMKYQTFEGFGGAATDSAGYVWSLMEEAQQKQMTDTYFRENDMNYRILRIPIDSCDFSLEHYEAMSDPNDWEFKSFDLTRMERYIMPLLAGIEQSAGRKPEIMVTPWSPPAFMKSNGERNNGGSLKHGYRKMWAQYICRYISELNKRGWPVTRLSLQNEPKAVQTWDSCIFTAEEEKEFLRDYLWPALQESGLSDVEVYIWDHNKERIFERAGTIIDEETNAMIAGIAFHWYSGDHFEALQLVREKFPDKKLILSEACIEYSKFAADDYLRNAQKYAHDIIGNLNQGMTAFYDWNLILDQQGGPNHVGNYCDAPYLYNTETGELQEQNTLAHIWHFSHFIAPGSRRIGHSRYTDELEMTAFENPDGTIAYVILNQNEKPVMYRLRINEQLAELTAAPLSIATGIVSI